MNNPLTYLRALVRGMRDWATGRRGRIRQVVMWIIGFAILLRIAAPMILTWTTNAALADGKDVRGSIRDVSLGLLTGTYSVYGLELRTRRESGNWVPLLEIATIRCDIEWLPLLRGELVGHGTVTRPVLHVLAPLGDPTNRPAAPEKKPSAQTEPAANPAWQDPVRSVIRARLTALNIVDGEVRYTDERHEFTTAITAISAEVDDLVIPEPSLTHRCPCKLTAHTPGDGLLQIDGEVDIIARAPIFLAHAKLEHVDLVALNPIITKFDNLTFAAGTFSGYVEVVADGRNLGGYLKVLFHDLDLRTFHDAGDGKGTASFWAVVIAIAEDLLENTEKHQHAARIPLKGPLPNPSTDVWTALATALSNAFIRALAPGFERPATADK